MTISQSTEKDLRRLGFTGPITVVGVGLEPMRDQPQQKAAIPTFLYVGRISPSKRVEGVIRAFAAFQKTVRPAQLWIVGEGEHAYVETLKRTAQRFGVSS